jgi:hypothetical protein
MNEPNLLASSATRPNLGLAPHKELENGNLFPGSFARRFAHGLMLVVIYSWDVGLTTSAHGNVYARGNSLIIATMTISDLPKTIFGPSISRMRRRITYLRGSVIAAVLSTWGVQGIIRD